MEHCEAASKGRSGPKIPDAVLAEAAVWLVRMSGPARTEIIEQGFRQWLAEHSLHQTAFTEISGDWEHLGEHKADAYMVVSAEPEPALSRNVRDKAPARATPWFAMAAGLAIVAISGLIYFLMPHGVATGIGEQRILTLEDGTKVYLNTSTRIVVAYDKSERQVRLESGEALFEVAKQAHRPFTVAVADRKIIALGTSFLVRWDEQQAAVTLVEGKVEVSSQILSPGERVTFAPGQQTTRTDRPSLPLLTAWQQGKVSMEGLPLSQAVAEMNRYSATTLVIEQPMAGQMPVTGVFAAGQSASFARAVAETYGLKIVEEGSTIILAGAPRRMVRP